MPGIASTGEQNVMRHILWLRDEAEKAWRSANERCECVGTVTCGPHKAYIEVAKNLAAAERRAGVRA